MIKPDAYWAMHKHTDPYTLGRVAATLGGQTVEPPLNSAESAMVATVQEASEWYDESVEKQRERWKKRQAERRARDKQLSHDVTVTNGDTVMSHDVTVTNGCLTMSRALPPSLPPVPKGTNNALASVNAPACARVGVDSDFVLNAAQAIGVPPDYAREFEEIMRTQDWAYVNPAGKTVGVTLRNLKTVMGAFWRREKEKRADSGTPQPIADDELKRLVRMGDVSGRAFHHD